MITETKATKLEALEFIRETRVVDIYDLMVKYDYTKGGAKIKIHRLKKQGLITNIGPGKYVLTLDGFRRLDYYDK